MIMEIIIGIIFIPSFCFLGYIIIKSTLGLIKKLKAEILEKKIIEYIKGE